MWTADQHSESPFVHTHHGRRETALALGIRLRAARKAVGSTILEAALDTGIHYSRLSRIERGLAIPRRPEIVAVLDALQLSTAERESLLSIADDLDDDVMLWHPVESTGSRSTSRLQRRLQQLEKSVTHTREYTSSTIPGLLQTPEYMRGIFSENGPYVELRNPDDLDAACQARIDRQQQLYEPACRFEYIIHESAFWVTHADPRTMAVQAHKLAVISLLHTVDIAVIPAGTPLPLHLNSGFVIFDEIGVWGDLTVGIVVHRSRRVVRRHIEMFEEMRTAALRGDDARSFLVDLAARLDPTGPMSPPASTTIDARSGWSDVNLRTAR